MQTVKNPLNENEVSIENESKFDKEFEELCKQIIKDGTQSSAEWQVKKYDPSIDDYRPRARIPHDDYLELKEIIRKNSNWGGEGTYHVVLFVNGKRVPKKIEAKYYIPEYQRDIVNSTKEYKFQSKNDKKEPDEIVDQVDELFSQRLAYQKKENAMDFLERASNKNKENGSNVYQIFADMMKESRIQAQEQAARQEKQFQMFMDTMSKIATANQNNNQQDNPLIQFALKKLAEDPLQQTLPKILNLYSTANEKVLDLQMKQVEATIQRENMSHETSEFNERLKMVLDTVKDTIRPMAKDILSFLASNRNPSSSQNNSNDKPKEYTEEEVNAIQGELTGEEAELIGEVDQLLQDNKTAEEVWDFIAQNYTEEKIAEFMVRGKLIKALKMAESYYPELKRLMNMISEQFGGIE